MNGPGFNGRDPAPLLERVVDASRDLVYVYDEKNHLRLWNRRVEEELGYDRDQLASKPAEEFVADGERATLQDAIAETRRDGEAVFEAQILTADGGTIPHEIQASELTDDDGQFIGRVGIARDITDRQKQERETERRAAALSASIDGMSILDEDEEYVFVNDAHAEVYGYDSPDEFLGDTWRMCYGADERARFETEVIPQLAATGAWRGEATGLRKDGTTFPQAVSLTTIPDGGLVCVVRDISEAKQREQELREQKQRLDEFGTVVSHDLRGPLNVAGGHLDILAEEVGDERVAPVRNALAEMERLIDDVLALAREGRVLDDEEVQPVSLAAMVDRAETTAAPELGDMSVTDVEFRADPDRLTQLLENLLRNCAEHAPPDGGTASDLRVEAGPLADADGFYVADDGSGIPVDDPGTLFEPSYTTDGGTGFGLTIVQRIAEAHGWDVRVADSDEGARFEFVGADLLDDR
ncbi:PAS domain S-box protein [Halorarius halobius]|uniref:PAS domain S-box protein n=1 Tax=Halorarius halobius TaxID=2962671 RepID=UPI0020CBC6BC|nr:PAS domain S-box protein [Halorarius halobius]